MITQDQLDEALRIIHDIITAKNFQKDLVNNKGNISVAQFGNGENVFVKLDEKVTGQLNEKIASLTQQLKAKIGEIK